jgi:hypothetical protein
MTTHTINEGTSKATGVTTRVHFEDESIVIQKTVDMEPYVERARLAREANEGRRWGEGMTVGTLPPDVYGKVILIQDHNERKRFIREYFQQNPVLVHYEPYLKVNRKD